MDFCIRVSLYALAHACLCLTDEETMRVMEKTYLFVLSPLEASQISLGFTSEGFPSCVAEPCGKTSNACGHMWWGWLKRNTHIICSSKKESVRLRGQKHTEISLLFVYEDSGIQGQGTLLDIIYHWLRSRDVYRLHLQTAKTHLKDSLCICWVGCDFNNNVSLFLVLRWDVPQRMFHNEFHDSMGLIWYLHQATVSHYQFYSKK